MPKITELSAQTQISSDDILVFVNDPGGTPTTYKIAWSDVLNSLWALPVQLPNMTTTERNLLTPAVGMLIFNTSTVQVEQYKSGAWSALGGGSGGGGATTLDELDDVVLSGPGAFNVLAYDTLDEVWKNRTLSSADISDLQTLLDAKQPLDTDLTTIAGLTATTNNVIQSVSGTWASRTPAQLKATLSLVKGDVGLGNVDNTSDANKPISTATQTALNDKVATADLAATVQAYTLDLFAAPAANLNLNSKKIVSLTDPTSPQDAATKAYVDSVATGLDLKASVRAATTANISDLSSVSTTMDGVTLVQGDRVLVKDQSTGSQNGIYVVGLVTTGTAPFTRATDADSSAEVTSGMFTFVTEGTVNGNNGFVLTTDDPITLGSTALVFTQFSGAGQITAGAGLTKTGNTIDIGAGTGITVNSDTIQISASYSGQTSIVTLGTIVTGVWNGTAIAAVNGGTGQTTYAKGDILASPGSNTLNKLTVGTDGFYLIADAASTNGIKWAAFAASGSTKQVQFNDAGALAGAATLGWDKTNTRLGVGTLTPGYVLDVVGEINTSTTYRIAGTIFISAAGATTNVFVGNGQPTSPGTGGDNTVVGQGAGAGLVTTGASNVIIGSGAGPSVSTGVRNTIVGKGAGPNQTTANDSVSIGWSAGGGNPSGSVRIGQQAGANWGSSHTTTTTAIGYQAGYGQGSTVANSVFIGYAANADTGGGTYGNRHIYIGDSATNNSAGNPNDVLCIGYQATATAGQQAIFGGTGNPLQHWYIGRGKTSASAAPIDFQASDRTGSNVVGNSFTIAAGIGTGAGKTNFFKIAVPYQAASGSSAQALGDRVIVAQDVSLSDAAISLFEVALPTLKLSGGHILWTIEAGDGTDFQVYSGITSWTAVNKGGSYTTNIVQDAANDSKAVSAGTLTASFDILTGTNKVTIRVTPAGSLSEGSVGGIYRISFTIINNTPQLITLL